MKSIAYSFIGFFFALLSTTKAQAGCKGLGLDGLRMQVSNSGQAAMIIFPEVGPDGKRISINAQSWHLMVDRSGSEISVRFTGDGQSIEILDGQLEENKGASSIFRLKADSRVGQVQVSICDGQGSGPLLNQNEIVKLIFNISDTRVRLILDYERRFKPGALASGTASQVSTSYSIGHLQN